MLSDFNMCLQRDTLKSTPLKTFLRTWEWDIESQDKAGDRKKNCLKSLGKELMGLPDYLSVTWGRRRTQIREGWRTVSTNECSAGVRWAEMKTECCTLLQDTVRYSWSPYFTFPAGTKGSLFGEMNRPRKRSLQNDIWESLVEKWVGHLSLPTDGLSLTALPSSNFFNSQWRTAIWRKPQSWERTKGEKEKQ